MNSNTGWVENRTNIIRWVGTIFAIALIVWLLKEEGGDDLVDALKRISIWHFIACIVVMLVSRLFVVLRWHVLLRSGGVDISLQRTAMLTFTGLFSSNFLPTTIGGDVVRLAGAMQLGYDRAICLASLVADRLIGMIGMAIALPFGLIPVFAYGKAIQSITIASLFSRSVDFIKRIFDAFAIWLRKPVPLMLSFLSTFGNMLFIFLAIYLLIDGLGQHVSYWLIAGLWSLTYFVTLIPISVNGFGVQELSLTFLLSRIGGLNHSESLTVAILIRTLFLLTSLPGAYFLPSTLAAISAEKKKTLQDHMRILVVIHEFPPVGGGGGRAAYDICMNLARRGHEIVVLTAHMRGLAFEENLDGIRIVRIPSFRTEAFRATFFVMLAFVLGGLWSGLRVIRQFQPDIIHTHFAVPSGALAWALSLMSGIPYVLTAHLGDVPGGVPEKTGAWFRWLMPFTHTIWQRAKRVVAVSEFTRQLALRHYNVDIEVIPNGADVQLLSPSEIRINQPPRLVFAGRFVTQKNILAIIQTLAQLKHLDWRCVMLGDGPLFEEAKTEIKRNDIEERFELPGWLTPGEVLEWFTKSDILFMPSLSEGLPVVGVQALARGLALVVSNIGGFMDLVDDRKNGYLIDLHDQHRFVHVLQDLLSDPILLSQFRKQSLEKAGHFELDSISKKYEDIFLNVLSRSKK